jgi:hypothetical protein
MHNNGVDEAAAAAAAADHCSNPYNYRCGVMVPAAAADPLGSPHDDRHHVLSKEHSKD